MSDQKAQQLVITLDEVKKTVGIDYSLILFYGHSDEIYKISVVSNTYNCVISRKNSYHSKNISRVEIYPADSKAEAERMEDVLPEVIAMRNVKRQAGYRNLYKPRPRAYLDKLPHFVYQYLDEEGKTLYVGATSNLKQRIATHRGRIWTGQTAQITIIGAKDRASALALEKRLIQKLKPPYNWRHKEGWDGKTPVSDLHPLVIQRLNAKAAA